MNGCTTETVQKPEPTGTKEIIMYISPTIIPTVSPREDPCLPTVKMEIVEYLTNEDNREDLLSSAEMCSNPKIYESVNWAILAKEPEILRNILKNW